MGNCTMEMGFGVPDVQTRILIVESKSEPRRETAHFPEAWANFAGHYGW